MKNITRLSDGGDNAELDGCCFDFFYLGVLEQIYFLNYMDLEWM